jgi:hypothetical protein
MAGTRQEGCPGATWFTLLAYSIVALAALLWEVDKVSDESSVNKWCVSAISISVAFSGLAVIASTFMKSKFTGTAMEGGLVRLGIVFLPCLIDSLGMRTIHVDGSQVSVEELTGRTLTIANPS